MRKRRQSLSHILTLRIAPTTNEQLEAEADTLDIPVSELLRRIINHHLEGHTHGTSSTSSPVHRP